MQSWLRDGDFLFWAKSKNPENSKIPGIEIGILKPLKNPEKISSAKSRKSRESGWGFENPEKSRENPEKKTE